MELAGLNAAFFIQIFQLPLPWVPSKYRIDTTKKQLHVWIVATEEIQKRTLLRATSEWVQLAGEERVWRHLDVAGHKTFLHVTIPPKRYPANATWVGDMTQPFTKGLYRHLFDLLGLGLDHPTICKIAGMRQETVTAFQQAIERGLLDFEGNRITDGNLETKHMLQKAWAEHAPQRLAMIPTPTSTSTPTSTPSVPSLPKVSLTLPSANTPIWMDLAQGLLHLDINHLGLKFLLTKIQSQLQVISEPKVQQLKSFELHRFFTQNKRQLTKELQQLQRFLGVHSK